MRIEYKGAERVKRHLCAPTPPAQSVAALTASLPAWRWYRRTVSEGTKGPIAYDFARQRVTLCKEGLPEHTVWLVIKRGLGAEPRYSYAISNAPAKTPFRTLIWLSGVRWAVEQCFEECKTELGMAHYEVRKYPGWHHHMMLTMLAHFFLWHVKVQAGKKSASADGVASEEILSGGLTAQNVDDCRAVGDGSRAATAQSPRLSLAS